MSENKPEFTDRDAAMLIVLGRRAPLQDMAEAESVRDLLDRFANWYEFLKHDKDPDPGSD